MGKGLLGIEGLDRAEIESYLERAKTFQSHGAGDFKKLDTLRGRLEGIARQLPPGLKLDIIRDQSVFIKGSVDAIYEHLILGGLLASIVVFLFMGNWRASLIAAVAIPTSIIATFLLVEYAGMTLNTMTLGGFALAVGILVDDATVTIENINWHLEQGKDVETAIMDGARQIVTPAFVSLLCICIVFVPMFFLEGVAGFLFVPMAEAVMSAMACSFIRRWARATSTARWVPWRCCRPRCGRRLQASSGRIRSHSISINGARSPTTPPPRACRWPPWSPWRASRPSRWLGTARRLRPRASGSP